MISRLLPKTLFGQLALALFSVLLLVQVLGLWLMLDERSKLNYKLLAEYSARRTGGIITALEQADPQERAVLVKALSVPPTTLTLALPWAQDGADQSNAAQTFVHQAREQSPYSTTIQVLRMETINRDLFAPFLHPPEEHTRRPHERTTDDDELFRFKLYPLVFIAQARLRDGTTVTFHHVLPKPTDNYPTRVIALLALLSLSAGLLSIWAVRRLTRPLASFADAAAGLARNLNNPAMPETGTVEVRRAAEAFNAMQRALKRYIDTRAQALSAVSHDLRLPLTRLRLRLEAIPDPALRNKMSHDLTEMDTMIGHTLDFLRAGSNTEPPVLLNLDALLDSVVEDMEELGAQIRREGRSHAPITARPHALRRCIANLLENARCYGGGGTIELHLEDLGKEVRLHIRDHGPGIPEADLEKVLEPYFRLEASRARHTGGTGLGLAIAKAIVEMHGGSLTLKSPPGRGLTASISLPRIQT
ncbi:ATP-binding protein [Uliginosibacterium gangwonense]|uniref:ATP-binding protein n=1 Tax=Uliginosibacterium gangwonense TaxID=392736 RepID=UPI00036651EF|nr:ATP-binding protein [Uliginosibacterium gangwonense]